MRGSNRNKEKPAIGKICKIWLKQKQNKTKQRKSKRQKLEVLIEKGSAAVSCNANRTKTVCRTVEHMNFLLKSIT